MVVDYTIKRGNLYTKASKTQTQIITKGRNKQSTTSENEQQQLQSKNNCSSSSLQNQHNLTFCCRVYTETSKTRVLHTIYPKSIESKHKGTNGWNSQPVQVKIKTLCQQHKGKWSKLEIKLFELFAVNSFCAERSWCAVNEETCLRCLGLSHCCWNRNSSSNSHLTIFFHSQGKEFCKNFTQKKTKFSTYQNGGGRCNSYG